MNPEPNDLSTSRSKDITGILTTQIPTKEGSPTDPRPEDTIEIPKFDQIKNDSPLLTPRQGQNSRRGTKRSIMRHRRTVSDWSEKKTYEIYDENDGSPRNRKKFTNVITLDDREITQCYDTDFAENKDFSSFNSWLFVIMHCISGLYYGYAMCCMNNLATPILKRGMGVTDTDEITGCLGNIALCYGLGKLSGSFVGGSVQKVLGKLNLLFMAELLNIGSMVAVNYFG